MNNQLKSPDWWRYPEVVWQQFSISLTSNGLKGIEAARFQSSWEKIEGGVTNFNYRVNLAEQSLFVQILDADKIQRLPNQTYVPCNQVMAHNPNLKPWLVPCLFESQQLRVFEWVNATNSRLETLQDRDFGEELSVFLSVLHNTISVLPILNIQQHLQQYYKLAIKRSPHKKVELKAKLARAEICAKSFSPSKNCHNDLSPGNILYANQPQSSNKLIVVDWEYACISDPFFDIAGISINFGFSLAQEESLIQNYSEKLSLYPNWEKFNKMKELYQLVSQLWSA